MKTTLKGSAVAGRLVAAVVLAPLALATQAAPGFAGPSLAQTGQRAEFVGRGFAPNAPVSISVTSPAGVEAVYGAVVDANGVLRYALTPDQQGPFRLKVLDTAGRVLRETQLNVAR